MNSAAASTHSLGKQKEAPLVEKLDDDELFKFDKYLKELEEKIEKRFGGVKTSSRLNVVSFKQLLTSIKKCKFEGIVIYVNKLNRQMISFARVETNNEESGEEAFASLSLATREELKLPWLRRFHVFDHPFKVEYRERDGVKFVALKKDFDYFKYSAKYQLMIREY